METQSARHQPLGAKEPPLSYEGPSSARGAVGWEPSRTLDVTDRQAWNRSLLGLSLLRPLSRWVTRWDALTVSVDLTYTAFLVPLSVAFSTTHTVDWLVGLDIAATAVYALDVLVQLHTGFILHAWDGECMEVLDGPAAAWAYLRHGYGRWDIPAVLAIIPEAVLTGRGGGNLAWKLFYFMRMLRLARVTRLARIVWGAALSCRLAPVIMFYVTTATLYGLCVFWTLAVIVNCEGCILWWLAELQGLDRSWPSGPYITQPQLFMGLLPDQSDPVKWLYSVHFALSTITTAVYGDAIATTVPEIVLIMIYDFFSVFWWAVVVTLLFQVVAVVSRRARKASRMLDRLQEAEGWMQERLLPPDLQQKVRRYYAEVWGPHAAEEDVAEMESLPPALRGEIVWRAAGKVLSTLRLLGALPLEALQQLAPRLKPMRVVAGGELFRQGDESEGCCYVLHSGEVAVLRGCRQVAAARAPALLGQAALLAPLWDGAEAKTRLHTVRAVSNCTLWALPAAEVALVAEDDPTVLPALCSTYLQHLRELQRQAGGLPSGAAALCSALQRQEKQGPAVQVDSGAQGGEGPHADGSKDSSGATGAAPAHSTHGAAAAAAAASSHADPRAVWLAWQGVEAAAASVMQEADDEAAQQKHSWDPPLDGGSSNGGEVAGQTQTALDASSARRLLAGSSATLYNSGVLDGAWRSWSWGTSYYNAADTTTPAPGSRASMCLGVQPYGALSLKSSMPFPLEGGMLGLYLRGTGGAPGTPAADSSPNGLGDLELQFESSNPRSYTISRSRTLREVVEAQAAADGSDADALLAAAAAGQWVPLRVDLADFLPQEGGTFRADRLTLGYCLQRLDTCSAGDALPAVGLCLDHVVLLSSS